MFKSAAQDWLRSISVMQQSVLFSAVRGPDGFRKHHEVKPLLRWYRRCVLISAFDGVTLDNPHAPGGGSFTGPSIKLHDVGQSVPFFHYNTDHDLTVDMEELPAWGFGTWQEAMVYHVNGFVHARDEMTLHYYAHAMHAFGILGYKHPDMQIRQFWNTVYYRMCNALHLPVEDETEMDRRLCDNLDEWAAKSDEAGSCSE